MLYFYQSEEMHFYLRTYLLTCYIVGLFSSLFSYVFIRYQFHIYGDIVIFHRKFLQNHTQKTAYILAGNTYYNLSGRSRNWMNWIDFILKTYGAFKFLTQINIIRKKIYIYIYIYILYIYYIYIIYIYIYIYIHPQTCVSSCAGLIGVARVTKQRMTDVTSVFKAPGAELKSTYIQEYIIIYQKYIYIHNINFVLNLDSNE